jgi:hypothetical protein
MTPLFPPAKRRLAVDDFDRITGVILFFYGLVPCAPDFNRDTGRSSRPLAPG